MNELQKKLVATTSLHQALLVLEKFFKKHELHYGHGTETPRDEAVYLLFEVCGLSYEDGETVLARVCTSAEKYAHGRHCGATGENS